MSGIARTQATGGAMLESLVTWSSSIDDDAAFVREDLLGSAAHATMLGARGIIPADVAIALRAALLDLAADGGTRVPMTGEEDVHMAVESLLTRTLGPEIAGRLHTARSRNDQVALDLRLFSRDRAARILSSAVALGEALVARAGAERDVILAAYTHRQRAQPISGAFLIAAWTAQLVRAAETVAFALDRANVLPLGSGACSGSSLPIDRALTARLLGFPKISHNALDTVGDRDFALDLTWAVARLMLALGKISTDLVDFSTTEFATVRLDGEIAAGSSMMPQKKNPDVFELIRGKSAHAVANVTHLLVLVKGLASGYNRDQQEDRRALLSAPPLALACLDVMASALPHVHFDRARGLSQVDDGFTQATDLAEALVKRGIPFREAYKAVGALVRKAVDERRPLRDLTLAEAQAAHAALDGDALAVLDPVRAVAAKESAGGTGPASVERQLEALSAELAALGARARAVATMDEIAANVSKEPLG